MQKNLEKPRVWEISKKKTEISSNFFMTLTQKIYYVDFFTIIFDFFNLKNLLKVALQYILNAVILIKAVFDL